MDSKGMFDRALEKAQPAPKKKRRKKKTAKRIIATIIVLAILGGIAFGMYSLFKEPEEPEKEIMPGFVYRGSIQSMVTGSGSAKPTDSTTITLTANNCIGILHLGNDINFTNSRRIVLATVSHRHIAQCSR